MGFKVANVKQAIWPVSLYCGTATCPTDQTTTRHWHCYVLKTHSDSNEQQHNYVSKSRKVTDGKGNVHTACSMFDHPAAFPSVLGCKHDKPLCFLIWCNGKQFQTIWKWLHLICHHIPLILLFMPRSQSSELLGIWIHIYACESAVIAGLVDGHKHTRAHTHTHARAQHTQVRAIWL